MTSRGHCCAQNCVLVCFVCRCFCDTTCNSNRSWVQHNSLQPRHNQTFRFLRLPSKHMQTLEVYLQSSLPPTPCGTSQHRDMQRWTLINFQAMAFSTLSWSSGMTTARQSPLAAELSCAVKSWHLPLRCLDSGRDKV